MTSSTKYDLFMDELNSLEKMVLGYIQKADSLNDENKLLKVKLKLLEEEKEVLKNKVDELENNSYFPKSNTEKMEFPKTELYDRESVKNQIDSFISKIDYYISS